MDRLVLVVKLGGSVVTDKSTPFSYRDEVVGPLAREMSSSAIPAVVVHGGGSFGHPVAKEHGLSSFSSRSTAEGVSKTREAMFRLNRLVCSSLAGAGMHPYTFTPFDLLKSSGTRRGRGWLEGLLDAGLTPVTFGDVVSGRNGFSILSGDTICYELSRILRPARCVFAMSVDGVLDGEGRVVKRVTAESAARLSFRRGHDATGGIALKLREALRISSLGVPVSIVSGLSPRDFRRCIEGRAFRGTVVGEARARGRTR